MERPRFIEDYLIGGNLREGQQRVLNEYAKALSEKVFQSYGVSMKWPVSRGVTNIVHQLLSEYGAVLRGQQVIEIGPGLNPLATVFLAFGARRYIGIEPIQPELTEQLLDIKDPRITVARTDGLTYLLQQPDESAVVMSFGVLDWRLYAFSDAIWNRQEIDDYMRLLIKEVWRVTPSGAITIQHPNGDDGVALFFDSIGFLRHKVFHEMAFIKP